MNKVTFDNMRSSGGIPLDSYWVKYSDVEALQAENKALKDGIRQAINAHGITPSCRGYLQYILHDLQQPTTKPKES